MEVAGVEPGNCHTDIIDYCCRSTDPKAAPHSYSCFPVATKDPFARTPCGSQFWPVVSITGRGRVEARGANFVLPAIEAE